MSVEIYHNPRCSKSRAALALLEARGIDYEIVDYLREPPTAAQLERLLGQLGLEARDVVRTGEPAFRESGLGPDSPPAALIELLTREPSVLQRPIVVADGRARIGRPPERILELFA